MNNKMPRASYEDKKNVTKAFWQYLCSQSLKPPSKLELRQVYYEKFKSTLDYGTPSVAFSGVLFHLQRMKRLVKCKDGSNNILYFERRGRRLVLAVDQSFVQRKQKSAALSSKEKGDDDEKDIDEVQPETKVETEDNTTSDLKKLIAREKRGFLAQNKNGVKISSNLGKENGLVDFGKMQLTETAKITKITITNSTQNFVRIKRFVALDSVSDFMLSDKHSITAVGPKNKVLSLPAGKSYEISALFKPSQLGDFKQVIVFEFEDESTAKTYHIARFLTGQGTSQDVEDILPTEKYQHPKPIARVVDPSVSVVRGVPPPRPDSKLHLIVPLKGYDIPFSLRLAVNQGKLDEKLLGLLESEVTMSMPQYSQKFSTLLHIEELQMEVDIRHYDMEDATLAPDDQRRGHLALKIPGLAEGRPSVIKGDQVFVRMKDSEGVLEDIEYSGFVHVVRLNDVLLKFSPKFHEKYIKGMKVNVRFTFNRLPLRLMHRALETGCRMMDENKLVSLNLTIGTHLDPLIEASQSLRFYDAKLHKNEEQEQAIKNIVAGTSRPIPYLLFGPPGTGKTVTIVEAIKQILRLFPDSRVLVCAPSNSASDLVLQRVMQHTVIPKSQMLRLNALGRSLMFLPKDLRDVSCISGDEFYFPSKEEIMEKRLVVCTLISAGRLVSGGIPDQHFTHVFIDEAGQSLQPECVVPLAGMFSTETPRGGQLVLAGDPQQLGPVLRSPVAIQHGLGISLLEWMMTKIPFYGRIPQDEEDELGEYNPKIITKLLKNYRSHPSILELPNEMFYDDELEACADRLKRESLCNWSRLPCKGFPIIFEGITGRDMREEKSPSFFNPEEAAKVVEYVKELTTARGINVRAPEIGVISPYRKQVQKITGLLKKANITDLKVGSVEEFQGQERRVIIISTVRSSSEFLQVDAQFKLGFLKNPKRFNVAITRAQALLIVVGNPHVLCKDRHWNRFIKFCKDSKGYRGCEFNPAADDEEDLMNRLKRVHLDSKEALEAVEFNADETVTQVAEQPAWRRGEDY